MHVNLLGKYLPRDDETGPRVPKVSGQTSDDLSVPSCATVFEDHEADNGHGDKPASKIFPRLVLGDRRKMLRISSSVKLSHVIRIGAAVDGLEVQRDTLRSSNDTNLAEHRIDLTSDRVLYMYHSHFSLQSRESYIVML